MKEERNTITTDGYGNITMPEDTANVWMSEPELVGLFGVTAPTVRAGIRAVYKSGVLKECDTKRYLRLEKGYGLDVYSLEMVVALAFRINSYGAERLRNAVLERLYLRKEKQTVLFSLNMTDIASPKYLA